LCENLHEGVTIGIQNKRRGLRGITLLEILVVILCSILVLALILPGFSRKRHSKFSVCLSNLKQVGLSFGLWRDDHGGKFPTEAPKADGGSKEFCETPFVFQHFKLLQPYLGNSPKVLICPGDQPRIAATNFQAIANSNISYFVGVDVHAGDTNSNANSFLFGDRNLTNGSETRSPTVYRLWTNQPLGWDNRNHTYGGNVVFADFHASPLRTPELQARVANFQSQTNRIAIP
jgi:hypothetical protein